MDPQASLTAAFGRTDPHDRLCNAFASRACLPVDQVSRTLSISPSTIDLSIAGTELMNEPGREYFLRTCLAKTDLPDDTLVVLDCPPSLGVLAVNCLVAAGGVLTVVQPGGFELHALVHLQMTITAVKERIHPDLEVLGAVITNAHRRRAITEHVSVEVGRVHRVLGIVRSDARMLYATSSGRMDTLTRSNALDDYAEVVRRLESVIR